MVCELSAWKILGKWLEISVKTHYPDANDVRISIRGVASRKTLRFYVPDSAEDAACCINGQVYRTEEASFLTIPMESDGTLLLSFQLTSRQEPAIGCTTVKGAQVTMLGIRCLEHAKMIDPSFLQSVFTILIVRKVAE